jgi:hypothetical protein
LDSRFEKLKELVNEIVVINSKDDKAIIFEE